MLRPLGTTIDAGARSASDRFRSNGRCAPGSISLTVPRRRCGLIDERTQVDVDAGESQTPKELRRRGVVLAREPRLGEEWRGRQGVDGYRRFAEHDGIVAFDARRTRAAAFRVDPVLN